MRRDRRVVLVIRAVLLAALVLSAGCNRGYRVTGPHVGALAAGPELARASVLRGLATRRFTVESDQPGSVVAVLESANLWLRIEVAYDGASYAIHYRESIGLDERVERDGTTRLDSRYRGWIDALATEIERAATMPDTLSSVPPPSTGGEVVAGASPYVTPTAPPTGSPYVSPTAPAADNPYEPVAREERGPTRLLEEVLWPGVALLGGGWIANWATTIGIAPAGEGEMIGISFIPIIGPFVQLGYLHWDRYQRWTGLFYPMMALTQITGLILTVVGGTVHIPTGEAAASTVSFQIVPVASPEMVGLTVVGSF